MIEIKNYQLKGLEGYIVPYCLIRTNEKRKKLMILFPGAGYGADKPLLYYSTMLYLENHFDVVHVNYDYGQNHFKGKTAEEIYIALQHDVKLVMEDVLGKSHYQEYHLVGKSIGTIAMASITEREELQQAKLIWLTPLLKNPLVYHSLRNCRQESLSIMGDQDPNYSEELHKKIAVNRKLQTNLLNHADHSLEVAGDTLQSADLLKNVLLLLDAFIKE